MSAGIVAAIAKPPGMPATNDAIDDWLVLASINFFDKRIIFSLFIPASIGPISSISSRLSWKNRWW